jgi:hypothetical protein
MHGLIAAGHWNISPEMGSMPGAATGRVSSEIESSCTRNPRFAQAAYAASLDSPLMLRDLTMKMYRLLTLFAAVLITVIFTWTIERQHVGATEEHLIQAAAP